MKFSLKYLMPPLAAVAAFTFASPAFAWSNSICNPTTGQVFGGNGASPLTTEALYFAYLHDHPGSFEMSPGKECQKAASQSAPTSVPTVVTTTAAIATAPFAVIEHDNRPWFCHYESTVGFAMPRRSNDLYKDLAKVGNTAVGANGLCDKPVETAIVLATVPLKIAGVQIARLPAATAPAPAAPAPAAPAPMAPSSPVMPAMAAVHPTLAALETSVEAANTVRLPESEFVPVIAEVVEFVAPAAGDGTGADVLVP